MHLSKIIKYILFFVASRLNCIILFWHVVSQKLWLGSCCFYSFSSLDLLTRLLSVRDGHSVQSVWKGQLNAYVNKTWSFCISSTKWTGMFNYKLKWHLGRSKYFISEERKKHIVRTFNHLWISKYFSLLKMLQYFEFHYQQ